MFIFSFETFLLCTKPRRHFHWSIFSRDQLPPLQVIGVWHTHWSILWASVGSRHCVSCRLPSTEVNHCQRGLQYSARWFQSWIATITSDRSSWTLSVIEDGNHYSWFVKELFWFMTVKCMFDVPFQEIREKSANFSITDAKKIENRDLNRYRDVNPFDHSRVQVTRGSCSYINASLIKVSLKDAHRVNVF